MADSATIPTVDGMSALITRWYGNGRCGHGFRLLYGLCPTAFPGRRRSRDRSSISGRDYLPGFCGPEGGASWWMHVPGQWDEREQDMGEDRTNRGPCRAPRSGRRCWKEAAGLTDRLTGFITATPSRTRHAEEVIAQANTTVVLSAFFDALLDALDHLRPQASRCKRLRDDLISSASSSVERRRARLSPPRRSRRS